jgi:hypothetical protein
MNFYLGQFRPNRNGAGRQKGSISAFRRKSSQRPGLARGHLSGQPFDKHL